LDAIAVSTDGTSIVAAAYFGARLVRWPVTDGALGTPSVLEYRPDVIDDAIDRQQLVEGEIGIDHEDDPRVTSLTTIGDSIWLTTGVWFSVAKFVHSAVVESADEGREGIQNLGGTYSVALSGDGKNLYSAAWNVPHPAAFAIRHDDTLSPLPTTVGGAPPSLDYGQSDVVVTGDGRHVLAIDDELNRVHSYARAADGTLTEVAVSDDLGVQLAVSLTVSHDGLSVYVADFDGGQIGHAQRDGDRLIAMPPIGTGEPALEGMEDIVVARNDRDVYALAYVGSAVVRFLRDDAGNLADPTVFAPTDGGEPTLFGGEGMDLSADGRRMIVVSPPANRISLLARDVETGDLSLRWSEVMPSNGTALDANPGRVSFCPDGSTAHVALRFWDAVASFEVTDNALVLSDVLGNSGSTTALHWPNGIVCNAAGSAVYVAQTLGDAVTVLRRGEGPADGCGGICP
ncbi:MAG: DNA-binding beta-propeller fold protein YncE, partial [Myxococcota bacterium]